MRLDTFDILRCPFCGGRLELVTSMFHQRTDDEIGNGLIGCQCCIFPVVDGIPVMHLQPNANTARAHLEAGHPDRALRAMVGLDADADAERFAAVAASSESTYRDLVAALGAGFEGGYFLYRFSDPTFVVSQAVVRAVAREVLHGARRAIDVCGGSGHLTRSLLDLSSPPPVLADLYFPKVWLARRFTAPGCEPICCDGNGPFPFARGAFALAMCSDAFMFIWTKRLFVGEMNRLVDGAGEPGAVAITHAHNLITWSPSHGNPLTPNGYRDLFEGVPPRVFAETGLFKDVVDGGPLDLGRVDSETALEGDAALTCIATRHEGVFRAHDLEPPGPARGVYRVNPLYETSVDGQRLRLHLRFPNRDYEDEYGACRAYLPEETSVPVDALRRLEAGGPVDELLDLIRRKVIVDLPTGYY
jgi:uncharacterized protein YbaR (Trm112 family)